MQSLHQIQKLLLALVLLSCAGCQHMGAYTPPIQQGNELRLADVSRIKVGMPRNMVAKLLGQPVLIDPYNQRKWTYIYRLKHSDNTLSSHYLVVHFDRHNKVRSVNTDMVKGHHSNAVNLPLPARHRTA
jgi:outer membrane protein assembly factor BamE